MDVQFPCMAPQFVATAVTVANHYNPNQFTRQRLKLLLLSIKTDGLTQPIVVWHNQAAGQYVVIDGFHRFQILKNHFGVSHYPAVVLDRTLAQRLASTIRHNRARGRHVVGLMGLVVKRLVIKGWHLDEIASNLGMSAEEVMKLAGSGRVVEAFRHHTYSKAWVWDPTITDEIEESE